MASLAMLEYEVLGYASEICKILDESNEWFLLSRFASTPERKAYAQHKYEEISKKTDLILEEAKIFLPLIKEIVCRPI